MLTLKLLREEPQFVIERLAVKNFDASAIVEKILEQDRVRRSCQTELDAALAAQKADEAEAAKKEVARMKEHSKNIEAQMEESQKLQDELLVLLPNIPDDIVPAGRNADDNVVVRMGGEMPHLQEGALPHWELAAKYDIIDFDLGVKLTGAGFPVYKGKGAKLQRSLIQYFLDFNTRAGYMEIEPPVMVNEASGFGTGQLPDKEGQMYFVSLDKFYLVPTAEVPVTNIYRDTILSESDFPVKMTAYTPCFRREAGSYGKDVRGLNRLHQFDKVEIVQLSLPEASERALNEMVLHVERLVKSLGLPYRIVRLCGGDMSFTSAITYDFEVFSAAQQRWLEVSSVSNFKSYQANRLKLRYKDGEGKINQSDTRRHKYSKSAAGIHPLYPDRLIPMNDGQRVILGIDPGTMILGYGVILADRRKVHYVDMGVVDLRKEKDHFAKLNTIFTEVSGIISRYDPDDVAVEAPFYGKNPQVMLKLGRAQGAAIAAAIAANVPIFEYAPRKVKMAVTGQGAASKEQVALILSRTLATELKPEFLDASDALAIALCHFYQLVNPFTDVDNSTSWEKFVKAHPERMR